MPIINTGAGGSIQAGLVAWFDMQPNLINGNKIIARYSDQGTYTGTLVGSPTTGSTFGNGNYYIGFNGSSQYVSGDQDLDFARKGVSNHFSISLWYKFDASTSGAIITDYSAGSDATSIYRWEVQNGTNVIEFGIENGTDWSEATYYTNLGTSSFRHIVFTYDGANQRIYVDNSLVTTLASTYSVPYNSGQRFTWGGRFQSTAGTVAGRIGSIRYYNRAITSTEVSTLYEGVL